MSSTDRQNKLLLAEDWKKVYQSFKYADFKSYDFDSLRRTMINYLRTNYPEDFNDYIESSEYLALIDMIAFLGQNLSFRTDLNARENFLELAERRESILRLARLVSYNPTRNKAASGLLKIVSVSTTENVRDANGNSLSGRTIVWNDSVNIDWYDQFIRIFNGAFINSNKFGSPVNQQLVNGIPTEQYRINSNQLGVPVFTFNKNVSNQNLDFEVVSTILEDNRIVEESPKPGNQVALVYRDNGQGASSNSTGFFMHFKQGILQKGEFSVTSPVPNQKVEIDTSNINHDDVWLYSLDSAGVESKNWSKVDAVEGNNIVYNSINKNIKDIFSVITRASDRISLIFSDGIFGSLPKGLFRTYYRVSANRDYTIYPSNLTNITVRLPYVSSIGRVETITINLELKEAIGNASSTESNVSIKTNAPSTYYTQNRLITGEDYNVGPLGVSQDIIKVKAVNRTSSGISRYFDLLDPTGKYSTTNLFATDGILYKEEKTEKTSFKFLTKTDVEAVIENNITNIINLPNITDFYIDRFPNKTYNELNFNWNLTTYDTNRSTGFITDENGIVYQAGLFTEGSLRFLESGAMIKFVAPDGFHFMEDNTLMAGPADHIGAKTYIWTKVITTGDSISNSTNGLGPIVFNDFVPDGSILSRIQPKFSKELTDNVKLEIIDKIFAYRTFGLRYDQENREWNVIDQDNLNIINEFNLGLTGDSSNQQLDSSWLILFETNGLTYEVTYRTLKYIFESKKEINFYYNSDRKVYDSRTGKTVKDLISILNINNDINSADPKMSYTRDYSWELVKEYRDSDGYVNAKKVEISFEDSDDDGVVDDPDLFKLLVPESNYIFSKQNIQETFEYYDFIDASLENILIVNEPNILIKGNPIFYIPSSDIFYQLNSDTRKLTQIYNYKAYNGRNNIKFRYLHVSDDNSRIDPSRSNIIDTYILTRQYDTNYRLYLKGTLPIKPLAPSTDQLFQTYGSDLNKLKSISDEIIFHPVKYRDLFGSKSETNMQATFKIVKNSDQVINENTLKSDVIDKINSFFNLDNWDFGETFYWSELNAYLMKELSPAVSSIVIVPKSAESAFGSLMQINAEADEIFISSATVDDVEIISAITAERLKADGSIVTSATTQNVGIQSSTIDTNTSIGGYSS